MSRPPGPESSARARPPAWLAVPLVTVIGLVASGCGGSSSPSGQASPSAAVVVSTTHVSLGTVLVGTGGKTVYLFEKDTGPTSQCYGACATAWPPLLTTGAPSASGGAKAALIGTTKRTDGTMQVTYAGHPIYFYSGDTAAGQTTGEESTAFGAKWYVVSPAGKKIESD